VALTQRGTATPPADWDEAAQEYLGLAALYHGLTDLDPGQRDVIARQSLEGLVELLDSRRPEQGHPPFDPLAFGRRVQGIRDRLGR
jgi:hypothetical protein